MENKWFRIVAPHFVVGGIIENKKIIITAPILFYMTGWNIEQAIKYASSKEWEFEIYES